MKILMLREFFNTSIEYQEVSLAHAYVRLGHDVVVVTSTVENIFDLYKRKYDRKISRSIEIEGAVKIIRLPYKWCALKHIRTHASIRPILEEEKPDLIFVHDIQLNIVDCIRYVKKHQKTRFVLDYHADYSNSGRNWLSRRILHGMWRKWFLNRARPYLDDIYPIVPGGFDFLHDLYGISPTEMTLLPLGVDATSLKLRKATTDGSELRRQLGLGVSSFVVFSGGRLDPSKRTEILIDALEHLSDLAIEVIVVGDTDLPGRLANLKDQAQSQGLKNIRFVGWQTTQQIEDWMMVSDIGVFPSSQSILWQKATACGLPLIVGDSGGQNPSYMNWGNIQVMPVSELSGSSLAARIRSLFHDPKERKVMQEKAFLVANHVLDWETLARRTLGLDGDFE